MRAALCRKMPCAKVNEGYDCETVSCNASSYLSARSRMGPKRHSASGNYPLSSWSCGYPDATTCLHTKPAHGTRWKRARGLTVRRRAVAGLGSQTGPAGKRGRKPGKGPSVDGCLSAGAPLFPAAVSANDRHCAAQERQSAERLSRVNLGGRHIMSAVIIRSPIVVIFAVPVLTECRQCNEAQECRYDERLVSRLGHLSPGILSGCLTQSIATNIVPPEVPRYIAACCGCQN